MMHHTILLSLHIQGFKCLVQKEKVSQHINMFRDISSSGSKKEYDDAYRKLEDFRGEITKNLNIYRQQFFQMAGILAQADNENRQCGDEVTKFDRYIKENHTSIKSDASEIIGAVRDQYNNLGTQLGKFAEISYVLTASMNDLQNLYGDLDELFK